MIYRGIEDRLPTKVDVPLKKERKKKRIQTKSNKNIVKKVM